MTETGPAFEYAGRSSPAAARLEPQGSETPRQSQAQSCHGPVNAAMLEVAAQRLSTDRVSFQPADAQNLPFADATASTSSASLV